MIIYTPVKDWNLNLYGLKGYRVKRADVESPENILHLSVTEVWVRCLCSTKYSSTSNQFFLGTWMLAVSTRSIVLGWGGILRGAAWRDNHITGIFRGKGAKDTNSCRASTQFSHMESHQRITENKAVHIGFMSCSGYSITWERTKPINFKRCLNEIFLPCPRWDRKRPLNSHSRKEAF